MPRQVLSHCRDIFSNIQITNIIKMAKGMKGIIKAKNPPITIRANARTMATAASNSAFPYHLRK